jgi:hypothetical protein
MELIKKRFYFAKTKRGKKFHIFPKNFVKSLCMTVTLDSILEEGYKKLNKEVCMHCIEEYKKVKNSASFALFIG